MSNLVNTLHTFVASKGLKAVEAFHPQLAPQMTRQVAEWHRIIPDINWTVDKSIEKDGKTAFRYTATGTQNGVKVSWQGSAVATLIDGKIASLHVVEDYWARLIDAGIIPQTPEDNISGNWHGTLFEIPFTASFKQTTGNPKVTGHLTAAGSTVEFSGTNSGGHVTLSGSSPGGGAVTCTGTWRSGVHNKIDAHLNGGGFNNQAVTLTKG